MKEIIVSTKDDFIFKNNLYDEITIKNIIKKARIFKYDILDWD